MHCLLVVGVCDGSSLCCTWRATLKHDAYHQAISVGPTHAAPQRLLALHLPSKRVKRSVISGQSTLLAGSPEFRFQVPAELRVRCSLECVCRLSIFFWLSDVTTAANMVGMTGRRSGALLPSAFLLLVGGLCTACLTSSPAFVGQRPLPRASMRSNPPTVRYVGENFFERFARVARANVNKVLQGFEDPEKVLDQALDDMQGDLIRVRQSYAEVLATQRKLQSQKQQEDRIALDWYRRAELAVEKGDDELAKEALARRQRAVNKVNDLQAQIDAMTVSVEKLFDSVKALEARIAMSKEEKEELIARARTAKTTSQVNEMLSDLTSVGSTGAFERMKEKVELLENRAEVSQGLLPEAQTSGSLEDRFKQLEAGSAVEDELAKLKGQKALPAGFSGIDGELEAMRKKTTAN